MQIPHLDIPPTIGAMLLDHSPLFPSNNLDLNIFEPRYKAMLKDSLQGDWMFAIANLSAPEKRPYASCVAEFGTIGLISSSETLPDGRSTLSLHGLEVIRFDQWHPDTEYPTADISVMKRIEVTESHAETVRELLLDTMLEYLDSFPLLVSDTHKSLMTSIPSLTTLLDYIASQYISDSALRYEMLSELDDATRASRLISTLTS